MFIPISTYIPSFGTLSNITPFTYRDGETYATELERIRRFVNDDLITFINVNFESLNGAIVDEVNEVIENVNANIIEHEETFAGIITEVNAIVATINGSFENAAIAEDARDAAIAAKDTAVAGVATVVQANTDAQTAKNTAVAAKDAAVIAKDAAVAANGTAQTAATTATTANTNAQTAKTAAEAAATLATGTNTAAQTAKIAAESARDQAVTAKTSAETAKALVDTAKTAVDTAKTAIDNTVAGLTDTGWQKIGVLVGSSLGAGATHLVATGFNGVWARKYHNIVYLVGGIAGNFASGATIMTLPVGWRISATVIQMRFIDGSSGTGTRTGLTVDSNGNVTVSAATTGNVVLTGVSYPVGD